MTDTATDRTLVPTAGDARPRRGGRRGAKGYSREK